MKKGLTQDQAILSYLITNGPLTPIDALQKFRCFRLAAVINRLRNHLEGTGAAIVTERVTMEKGGSFAKYKLEGKGTPAFTQKVKTLLAA